MDGGAQASAKPVYHYFVNLAKKIRPNYFSLIMPARWYAGGKGLDDFRESMLSDNSILNLYDYANSKDCFPTVEIAGGVCYFLYDIHYKGDCNVTNFHNGVSNIKKRSLNEYPIFVRENRAVEIIHKVENSKNENMSNYVYSRNSFSLPSNERGYKNIKNVDDFVLLSSDGYSYISRENIEDKNGIVDKYKVIITYAMSGGNKPNSEGTYQILSSLMVLPPKTVCTETFLIIDTFSDKEQANNLRRYLATKFARCLLLQSLSSIHITKSSFQFVPFQNFTSSSDIDWSLSIKDIDKQLYAKYSLNKDDIYFIEQIIKSME